MTPPDERPDWTGYTIHAVERDLNGRLVRLVIVPGDERVNSECEMFTEQFVVEPTPDGKLYIGDDFRAAGLVSTTTPVGVEDTKFRVGDRVRIEWPCTHSGAFHGQIGEIVEMRGSYRLPDWPARKRLVGVKLPNRDKVCVFGVDNLALVT